MKLQAWDLRRGEVERANMHKARSKRAGGGAEGGGGGGGGGGEGGEDGGGVGEVSTFTTLCQPSKIIFGHEIWLIKSLRHRQNYQPFQFDYIVSPNCCFRNTV